MTGGDSSATPPKSGGGVTKEAPSGPVRRLALLIFALAFQILVAVALFVFIHVLRGHYEGSTYSTGQEIDAAVLGLPGVALGIGVFLLAIFNLFGGRSSGHVARLALGAVVLLAIGYGLELALK